MVTLICLRKDLRIKDNALFNYVSQQGKSIIPLFIYSEDQRSSWQMGLASKLWLHHALESFQTDLIKLGSKLIIRSGNLAQVVEQLLNEALIDEVIWNRAFEPSAIEEEKQLSTLLSAKKISAKSFNANLLFDPAQITNKQGAPFKIFTAFYNHCLTQAQTSIENQYHINLTNNQLKLETLKQEIQSLTISDLNLVGTSANWNRVWQEKMLRHWQISETAAEKQLEIFLDHDHDLIVKYPELRDRPDLANTSKLSCYLAFGQISPHRIWQATNGHEAYRRQLVWRDFANYILFHFPQTTDANFNSQFDKFPWRSENDPDFSAYLECWQSGQTGYPIVDAGMRELWETGWMHNRVRMIVGSFLTKDLLIHWKYGAQWFWQTLFDADLANNSMGWQWVAGCGVDASPYFRIFNPSLQGEKFDPQGDYIRRWLPELTNNNYPQPIVNHNSARLLALEALQCSRKQ